MASTCVAPVLVAAIRMLRQTDAAVETVAAVQTKFQGQTRNGGSD
jgi:hypothetical protein